MEPWHIELYGPLRVTQGKKEITTFPRSRAGAVLASLALSSVPLANSLLWERFWPDSHADTQPTSLANCVLCLRQAFGKTALVTRQGSLSLAPGVFTYDVQHYEAALREARKSNVPDLRIAALYRAIELYRGDFLENYKDPQASHGWIEIERASRQNTQRNVLEELIALLEGADNPRAALDIALRALKLAPDDSPTQQVVLRLTKACGLDEYAALLKADVARTARRQEAAYQNPEAQEAVLKTNLHLLRQGKKLTLREADLLRCAVRVRRDALMEAHREHLEALTVFPAPFSAALAQEVCKVPVESLEALAEDRLIERQGEAFWMFDVVQGYVWQTLSLARQRKLTARLARHYVKAMTTVETPANVLPASLGAVEQERPFLLLALEWVLKQPPILPYVLYINMLRHCGLLDLARCGLPYLRAVYENAALPVELRLEAALRASYIFIQQDAHREAIAPLEYLLPVAAQGRMDVAGEIWEYHWAATYHSALMQYHSHIGNWEQAKAYGQEAVRLSWLYDHVRNAGYCLRYLGEVHYNAGEKEQALSLCEEALTHWQEALQFPGRIPDIRNMLADARYWQARILYALKRWEGAYEAVEEALTLWQEDDNPHIVFCICLLGQMCAAQGRFAEARAHVHHALGLFKETGSQMYRADVVETLGDILFATGNAAEALLRYEECQRTHARHGRVPQAQRVQAKLCADRNASSPVTKSVAEQIETFLRLQNAARLL